MLLLSLMLFLLLSLLLSCCCCCCRRRRYWRRRRRCCPGDKIIHHLTNVIMDMPLSASLLHPVVELAAYEFRKHTYSLQDDSVCVLCVCVCVWLCVCVRVCVCVCARVCSGANTNSVLVICSLLHRDPITRTEWCNYTLSLSVCLSVSLWVNRKTF